MKIAPRIIGIFLPLFIAPLAFLTYLSISTASSAIQNIATGFLKFMSTELSRFIVSEYKLLEDNELQASPDFVEAAKRAVAAYATGLIRSPTQLIAAVRPDGTIEFSTSEVSLLEPEKRNLVALTTRGSQGWAELSLGGIARVADISSFKPFGWTLIVSEQRRSFFAAIDWITWESLITGITSLLAVIALVVVFSRMLTRPLSQIATAMREIVRTGDLRRRVDVRYADEVGVLGDSFNAMTSALEQAYGEIKNFALKAAIAQKREMKIRNVFQKYVPNQVIEQFFRAPESMLVGEERNLAVLFSDIRKFTEFSENMNSHDIVESLNRYFDGMVDAIMRNNGLVDKFIGDAVMAFFGAPAEDPESAYHSVLSALDMIDELKRFNGWQQSRGRRPIRFGIGINYGTVTIGNIGSERKMDYTVVGDMVNVASRLEGLTKFYDEQILISESIHRFVRDRIPCRQVDRVQVKGRSRGLAIYGIRRNLSQSESQAWTLHERALQHYYNREFSEALGYFESADKLVPDDPITRVFLQRSANYVQSPPNGDWTGVVAFTEK